MKLRQEVALRNPLRPDAPAPKAISDPIPRAGMTSMLAVVRDLSFAEGRPAWHVTVQIWDPARRLVPPDRASPKQLRRADRLAGELLLGVGDACIERRSPTARGLHFMRVLLPAEVAKLPGDWLDIPPAG